MSHKELPVFFDQTGRRWRTAKWMFGVSLALLVLAAALITPLLLAPVYPHQTEKNERAPSNEELEKIFNAQNTPVVGRGQFIRAVEVTRRGGSANIRDIFSGQPLRELNVKEAEIAGDSRYALERYGQLPDHQIILTFDDGPDPAYTPQLLDTLSKEKVPAAFFVVGANVVKHPKLAQRMVREGHTVANHTFSHIDFDFGGTVQGQQEINQTSRVLTAATGQQTAFMRVPYAGATDQSLRDSIKGILQAQRLGYSLVAYDYDTVDWSFRAPQHPDPRFLDGGGKIVLLHDSGGDRTHTLDYVEQLIPMARQKGYQFVGLDHAYPGPKQYTPAEVSFADKAAFALGQTVLVVPSRLMSQLFAFNVLLVLFVTGLNIVLAIRQRRRARQQPRIPAKYRPLVSVIVPAYNEAAVLEHSVKSVLRSYYKKLTVVIVDDGSHDETFAVARRLAAKYPRVKAIHQRNSGKAAALNNGIRHASGEVIICIDADTLFQRDTVWKLARHFHNPRVGGVAGYVRAGNIRNLLTRWQSLEYITSITLDRSAQAFLNAITVVPGACGAWRREALQKAGGFSNNTLAEDCDVALTVRRAGYAIIQDTAAISRTECPLTLGDLAKQRFRWTFGNIQSFWKHRAMFFNKQYGWLGMFVLPNAALSIILPMLFWPLLLGLAIANIAAGRWWIIVLFLGVLIALQFMVAWVALALSKESLRHMWVVPMTRLVYGPLRTYVLYRSLLTVLRGAMVGWNKLNRTKTVTTAREPDRPFRAAQPAAEE